MRSCLLIEVDIHHCRGKMNEIVKTNRYTLSKVVYENQKNVDGVIKALNNEDLPINRLDTKTSDDESE